MRWWCFVCYPPNIFELGSLIFNLYLSQKRYYLHHSDDSNRLLWLDQRAFATRKLRTHCVVFPPQRSFVFVSLSPNAYITGNLGSFEKVFYCTKLKTGGWICGSIGWYFRNTDRPRSLGLSCWLCISIGWSNLDIWSTKYRDCRKRAHGHSSWSNSWKEHQARNSSFLSDSS